MPGRAFNNFQLVKLDTSTGSVCGDANGVSMCRTLHISHYSTFGCRVTSCVETEPSKFNISRIVVRDHDDRLRATGGASRGAGVARWLDQSAPLHPNPLLSHPTPRLTHLVLSTNQGRGSRCSPWAYSGAPAYRTAHATLQYCTSTSIGSSLASLIQTVDRSPYSRANHAHQLHLTRVPFDDITGSI